MQMLQVSPRIGSMVSAGSHLVLPCGRIILFDLPSKPGLLVRPKYSDRLAHHILRPYCSCHIDPASSKLPFRQVYSTNLLISILQASNHLPEDVAGCRMLLSDSKIHDRCGSDCKGKAHSTKLSRSPRCSSKCSQASSSLCPMASICGWPGLLLLAELARPLFALPSVAGSSVLWQDSALAAVRGCVIGCSMGCADSGDLSASLEGASSSLPMLCSAKS